MSAAVLGVLALGGSSPSPQMNPVRAYFRCSGLCPGVPRCPPVPVRGSVTAANELNSTPVLSTPPPFPQKDIGYTIANPSKPGTTFGFRGKFFELESPVITSKYSEVGQCLACLSV